MNALGPIETLVPHAGAMVLLERVEHWDDHMILCRTRSHLDPANPLRRNGRLAALCGIEYGLQGAALHGALRGGGVAQPAGYVASLRAVSLDAIWLDDPGFGTLRVEARLQAEERFGIAYSFAITAEHGATLVAGRATVALPR